MTDTEILNWLESKISYMEWDGLEDYDKFWPHNKDDDFHNDRLVGESLRDMVRREAGNV